MPDKTSRLEVPGYVDHPQRKHTGWNNHFEFPEIHQKNRDLSVLKYSGNYQISIQRN